MGLLDHFRESSAIRSVEASLQQDKPLEEGVAAVRRLREIGTDRAVPILREALFQDNPALQVQAAHALAAIHERQPDVHILEALNGAVLHERQAHKARRAAIEALAKVVDLRHCGSLLEVLKSRRSPVAVRAAALQGLKKLHYPELLERLVECTTFAKDLGDQGATRRWAINELATLDDREKLTKMHEIIHGRRALRYRPLNPDGGQADLIFIMVHIAPKESLRFLHQMVDDDNPAIRSAAATALKQLHDRGIHE
ncbi:MAG: HEAT repeat domain-containing protein [bacterium]